MVLKNRVPIQFDREKLKQVILFACSRIDPSRLGAVKLHKVLYYSDMMHYAEVGFPLTGATYRKRPHGPTCDQLLSCLREMEMNLQINISEVDYFGYRKKEYQVVESSNFDRMSEQEARLLDEVMDFVCNDNSAKTISEFSHNRAWELVQFGDVIHYNSVFLIYPTEVSQEALDWAETEADRLASEKSNISALSSHDFGDFRKRVLLSRL